METLVVVGLAIAAVLALLACACGAGKIVPLMLRDRDDRAYKHLPGEKKRRHDKKAAELEAAMNRAAAAVQRSEEELQRMRQEAVERDRLTAEAMAAAQARMDEKEAMLALARKEAALRAAAYRRAMADRQALPDLEEGVGSAHTPIKPPIPVFPVIEPGKVEKGVFKHGIVDAPVLSPPETTPDELGWGSNTYLLTKLGFTQDGINSTRLGRLAAAAHSLLWTTPSSKDATPTTSARRLRSSSRKV